MSRIFISYRQEDSGGYSSQLCRRLQDDFGEENVFFDIKSIGLGADWWQVVEEKIRSCKILLAPVGPTWLTIADKNGHRRLDSPKDPLRREIETALKANLLMVPLLVGNATMPDEDQLPPSLKKFARCNATELRHASFERDVDALIEQLGLEARQAGRPAAMRADASGGWSGAPQPALPQMINLTGVWQSMTGVPHQFRQNGNIVMVEAYNAFGVPVMRGQGTLTGNQLHVVYEATYQPPYVVRGEAQAVVAPDGMSMTGQSVDQFAGAQLIQLRRVG